MNIINQQPCSVDGVLVPLWAFVYSAIEVGSYTYYCETHWNSVGFAKLNTILTSASVARAERNLVYDNDAM